MISSVKDKVKTALVIYFVTFLLGAVLALIAWNREFLIITPLLVGTFLCLMAGVFGRPYRSGEADVSEERA